MERIRYGMRRHCKTIVVALAAAAGSAVVSAAVVDTLPENALRGLIDVVSTQAGMGPWRRTAV